MAAQQNAMQRAYTNQANQANQVNVLGYPTTPYTRTDSRKITTIEIEETSNGSIIRIGGVTRICPTDGVLMDQIGAAYTEAKLK